MLYAYLRKNEYCSCFFNYTTVNPELNTNDILYKRD